MHNTLYMAGLRRGLKAWLLLGALLGFPGCFVSIGDLATDTNSLDASNDPQPPPQCESNEQLCSNHCVDTKSDPLHCGSCGINCGGGLCQSGKCQLATLASGQGNPWAVAVDDTRIFWTTEVGDGGLWTLSKSDAQDIAVLDPASGSRGLALDEDRVYWANPKTGRVQSAAKDGGDQRILHETDGRPFHVAVDETTIYWSERGDAGTIFALTKDSSAPVPIAQDQTEPAFVAVSATHVYWDSYKGGGVQRVNKQGGSPETIAAVADSQREGWGLALDSQYAYWLEGNLLRRVPLDGNGGSVDLLTDQPRGRHILVDGTSLFWTYGTTPGAGDDLSYVTKALTPSAEDRTDLVQYRIAHTHGIAVDRDFVYWTEWGKEPGSLEGGIFRLRRP